MTMIGNVQDLLRNLALLMDHGSSAAEALELCARDVESGALRDAVLRWRDAVLSGTSFWEAVPLSLSNAGVDPETLRLAEKEQRLTEGLRLLSENPPPARQRLAYWPFIGLFLGYGVLVNWVFIVSLIKLVQRLFRGDDGTDDARRGASFDSAVETLQTAWMTILDARQLAGGWVHLVLCVLLVTAVLVWLVFKVLSLLRDRRPILWSQRAATRQFSWLAGLRLRMGDSTEHAAKGIDAHPSVALAMRGTKDALQMGTRLSVLARSGPASYARFMKGLMFLILAVYGPWLLTILLPWLWIR